MCVSVWCYLEDPLENEMFHLKGLSSNKMMMKMMMMIIYKNWGVGIPSCWKGGRF